MPGLDGFCALTARRIAHIYHHNSWDNEKLEGVTKTVVKNKIFDKDYDCSKNLLAEEEKLALFLFPEIKDKN